MQLSYRLRQLFQPLQLGHYSVYLPYYAYRPISHGFALFALPHISVLRPYDATTMPALRRPDRRRQPHHYFRWVFAPHAFHLLQRLPCHSFTSHL